MGIQPDDDNDLSMGSGGATAALRFGIPLFCTSEIPPVARSIGVDPALAAALIAAESGFNPRAVSSTGARGLTQLTSRTARSLGVHNRHWPRWNLWGGITYLSQQLKRFGDEELALAAYTKGPTIVAKRGTAILNEPDVSAYVGKIQRLKRAYSNKYPNKCVSGGNGLGIAYADRDGTRFFSGGIGVDLQAFIELGLSVIHAEFEDSSYTDEILGTRIYAVDPLFAAAVYHLESHQWEVGLLTSLRKESIHLGIEYHSEDELLIGARMELPFYCSIGAKWSGDDLSFDASIITDRWHISYLQHRVDVDDESGIRHSIAFSVGRMPAL